MARNSSAPMLATTLVLALLGSTATVAHAESELYGGIGLGYSTVKADTVGTAHDLNLEDSSAAARAYLGFRYGRFVALEAGYVDFGKAKDQVAVFFGQPSATYRLDTTGYDLALLGRYPVNDELAAFARAGVIRWDTKARVDEVGYHYSEDGSDLMWGLGLDYRGTNRVSVRVEADVLDIGFADSWWMLSTSIMYGFPIGR